MKTLDNISIEDVKSKVPDVKVVGNGDTFRLLCKASSNSEGWMKSSKAMEIPGVGCVVQVTTQQKSNISSQVGLGGSSGDLWSVAEALVFVPNVHIEDDVNDGRKLVSNQPTMKNSIYG